ncbi:MAG: threonyl-tRNA synthetase editing domain-containing protein [Candidatus Thorarchaeota archaeon]|nr:threonyl-tRNA synthetase editing domain-containing protein [Candidatus Thorarchaeota archaeon]
MLHLESFWYRPNETDSEDLGTSVSESLLVWIQSEESDMNDRVTVLRKMVKNIRWLSKKIETNQIILHSFAHLGESKSEPEFADALIEEVARRLRDREYEIHIVPYGKFYEFKMHVKGPSLAKVFKQF